MMMLMVVVTQRMVDRTQSAADLCGTPSPPNIYTARRPTRTPASAAAAAAVRAAGTAIRTRNPAGRADASLFRRSAGVPECRSPWAHRQRREFQTEARAGLDIDRGATRRKGAELRLGLAVLARSRCGRCRCAVGGSPRRVSDVTAGF